jgi:hypothetical protein
MLCFSIYFLRIQLGRCINHTEEMPRRLKQSQERYNSTPQYNITAWYNTKRETTHLNKPDDKRLFLLNILPRMARRGAHSFRTESEPSKTTPTRPRLQGNLGQHTSTHAPRGVGEEKARSWQTWGRQRTERLPRPTLRPGNASLGLRPPPASQHHHGLHMPHRSLSDGLDGVFEKITTPWRRRLVQCT